MGELTFSGILTCFVVTAVHVIYSKSRVNATQ
jgi:hypothetical protein